MTIKEGQFMSEIDDWIYTNETQAPGQPLPPKP